MTSLHATSRPGGHRTEGAVPLHPVRGTTGDTRRER